jgi:hypothetical protein
MDLRGGHVLRKYGTEMANCRFVYGSEVLRSPHTFFA